MYKVIIGGIIGGIIAFLWAFVSWAVLPWHNMTINTFRNPEFVAWVIKENVTVDGVYMVPYDKSHQANLTPGEVEKEMNQQKAAMKAGPFVYAQVKVGGVDPTSPLLYITSFLTQLAGALLISILLFKVVDTNYGGRLLFVTMTGLIVGVLGVIPNWNWFAAGYRFSLVMMADYLIQWFLVGLFLAGFVKPKREAQRMM
ncbi:MAG: hypothetical protein K1060chlam2_00481 [Chlamydiae bacterium]|nr:hypothetical protein [Chlamydiota bacterium]